MRYIKSPFALMIATVLFWLFNPKVAPSSLAQEPEADVVWDTPILVPSPEETSSWFPDLAVDSRGRVHVVWNETNHLAMNHANPEDEVIPEEFEKVLYSVWNGQKWQPFNDIVPSGRDIIRNAITIDSQDQLHLVYGWTTAYYSQASVDEALSAAAWNSPRLINSRNGSYLKDIASYKGTLHLIYDDMGADEGECRSCADIFYRHSTDHGVTWSSPVLLLPTGAGSSRAQLEVDKAGTLYVAWDEGWDRMTGKGTPQHSIYTYSRDGGNTWESPTLVSYPGSGNSHLTVGADGEGGVVLVWRNDLSEHYYYMGSTDYGASWSPPKVIPGIFIESYSSFNMFDMATDSAGHIHLLITGKSTLEQENLNLYHVKWDGLNWSTPIPLYQGGWNAQYPHLVIDRGNQLHAVWYIREDLFSDEVPHQVWYAHGQASAPAEAAIIVEPTATPLPTASPIPSPTPIPTPTIDPAALQGAVPAGAIPSIYTDVDEILILLQSLLPAVVIIVVIVIIVRMWRH